MNHESKRPITIEDLLRLKRAERPPADFWNQFDRQLRAKQLAALVVRRPWWQRLPRLTGGFSRYHAALGTAAVLTLSLVSVRFYGGNASEKSDSSVAQVSVASAADVAVAPVLAGSASRDASAQPMPMLHVQTAADVKGESVAPVEGGVEATVAAAETRTLNAGVAVVMEQPRPGAESPARNVAAPLSVVQTMEPIITRNLLGSTTGFETRVLPARPAVEPLQQMTPPSERSRSRMLTAMVSMVSTEAPARTSERVADRLSEERLYDQIHRFGARGAGVSMKF